ncbi:MAG TPA: hypothetical protein VH044_17120, partial [Polyangiaceae bacterium]|nr:hypothetical protein [Polyangiaceae bacterium]
MPSRDSPAPGFPKSEGAASVFRGLLGPTLVIVGASMWGLETLWRVRLNAKFDADVLVFHEHWMGLVLTS